MSRILWPRSPCPANPDSTHAPRRLHSHHAGHPAPTIMWESNPNSGSLPTESGFGETARFGARRARQRVRRNRELDDRSPRTYSLGSDLNVPAIDVAVAPSHGGRDQLR